MGNRENQEFDYTEELFPPNLDTLATISIKSISFLCVFCGLLESLLWIIASYWYLEEPLNQFLYIKFSPAVLFIICGMSLWYQLPPYSSRKTFISKTLAAIVSTVGLFSIFQNLIVLGAVSESNLLPHSLATVIAPLPHLMAFFTALVFVLVGISLFFIRTKKAAVFNTVQVLISISTSILIISLYGYIFRFIGEFTLASKSVPAIASLILFSLILLGLGLLRPREGIISLITNDTLGGFTARRLILFPLVFVPLVSIIRISLENSLYLSTPLSQALGVFLNVFVLTSLIFYCAKILADMDLKNRAFLNTQISLTKKLQDLNSDLEGFAYIVSHELKAPLRGICSLADWFQKDYEKILDEQGKKQLGMLRDRAARMNLMINGILEYSRVGRNQEQPVAVNLNDMALDLIETLSAEKKINFIITPPLPTLICPPVQMRQVLQNLIGNAIKYIDKPEGTIRITCEGRQDCWLFCVSDNGPGIDSKYFEKIFQIFQSLGPYKPTNESTGVGLSIVKLCVEHWGGKIWVESKLGEGSSFYFTIPKRLS